MDTRMLSWMALAFIGVFSCQVAYGQLSPFPDPQSDDPVAEFFGDFYRQDICNTSTPAFGPSWCMHRNVGDIPPVISSPPLIYAVFSSVTVECRSLYICGTWGTCTGCAPCLSWWGWVVPPIIPPTMHADPSSNRDSYTSHPHTHTAFIMFSSRTISYYNTKSFVVPFLLSNATFPESQALEPNCSYTGDHGAPECRVITTVGLFEAGPRSWRSNVNYSSLHNNKRYVASGLQDGSIMVSDHNTLEGNDSVLYIVEKAHQAPVKHILPMSNGTLGYVLSVSDLHDIKVWQGNPWETGWQQCSNSSTSFYPSGYELIRVRTFELESSHVLNPKEPLYVVAVLGRDTRSYKLFYTLVNSCHDIRATWRTWTIDTSGNLDIDLDFNHRLHEWNYTQINPLTHNMEYVDRTIILLHNTEQISLFEFDWQSTNSTEVTVPFHPHHADMKTMAPSVFYRPPPGHEVNLVSGYADGIRRYFINNSTGSIGGRPAMLLWLAIAESHPGNSSSGTKPQSALRMLSLDEFSLYKPSKASRASALTNPVGRVGPWSTCAPDQWWDITLQKCAHRFVQHKPLLEKPIQLETRYRGLATDLVPFVSVYFCNFYCLPAAGNATVFKSCLNFFNIDECPLNAQQVLASTTANVIFLRSTFSQFMMNMFYLSYGNSRVEIFGVQQKWGSLQSIIYRKFNTLNYVGRTLSITPSNNGQYLFTAVSRPLWHMQSMTRLQEICDHLAKNHTHSTEPLESYSEACKQSTPEERKMTARHFAQMATLCPPGSSCPTLDFEVVKQVEQGFYTVEAQQKLPCPPGAFCPMGQKMDCPIGHSCDGEDPVPRVCSQEDSMDSTCYEQGLQAPAPCPDGQVCFAPYFPGLPVPPGFYVSSGARVNEFGEFRRCRDGEYCSLGRYNETLATPDAPSKNISMDCPPYFYCPSPASIEPVLCPCNASYCSYCPGGQFEAMPCEKGYFCTNQTSRKACEPTDYCPEGSVIYKKCDPGYYCPTPAERIRCPAGSFCRRGSVSPSKCHFLSRCPAGTSNEQANYLGVVLDALLLIGAILAIRFYRRFRDKRRQQRDLDRLAQQELSGNSAELTPMTEGGGGDTKVALLEAQQGGVILDQDDLYTALPRKTMTVDFQFQDLGLKLKGNGKTILAGVTGELRHGEVTAVMGPSGAGKTTFLSTLSDKASYGVRTGNIFINNKPGEIRDYKQLVGFVPQEDIMLRMMTVKETLSFSANQRLPASMSAAEKTRIVNAVIRVLGLERVRHSPIGDERTRGISGGQRKRVNIGMELVADPTVLFLDEPTSGLDSTSSKEVCQALRNVAEMGLTIVTVIHQPRYEIFRMFHTVLLLGEGGRTVYLGPSEDALPYFENLGFRCPERVNPPDFFMDVISGMVEREGHPNFQKEELFELWEDHSRADNEARAQKIAAITDDAPPLAGNPMSRALFGGRSYRKLPSVPYLAMQFFWRACVQQTRDLLGMFLDCALVYLAGLCLGAIYADAKYYGPPPKEVSNMCPEPIRSRCELPTFDPVINQASLTTLALSLTTVMASLRVFGNEQIVYWREASHGGTGFTLAYFLGKVASQIFNILLWPLVYLTIYYTITSPRGTLKEYYIILVLLCWAASSFAYLISIIVPPHLAYLAGVVLMLIFQMVAGTMPTLKQLKTMVFPMPYMPYISFMRWGQEALYLTEIEGYQKVFDIRASLDLYDYSLDNFQRCLGIVLLVGLIVRVLTYIMMVVLHRGKKR